MPDPMTPEQLAEAGRLIERAHTEIGDICKDGASRRWRLSIPAQPDRDSDLILSAALQAGEDALAEAERLRAELAEADHVATVTGEKLTAVRGQRNRAEAERDRIRLAWDSARRGRRSARLLNRELIASMGVLHGRLQQYMDDKNTAAAHFTNQYSRMHLERDQMRTERDEARAQIADVRAAIDAWQDGTTAPHDALTAIRDRLTAPERGTQ